ncbi:MAG TPA: HEAT repeat domain-containing protein, partial [Elusimicrobiota bacterium]|nr:HEAT repeat domain-containing protein [Elusimicrobiota bacterium]
GEPSDYAHATEEDASAELHVISVGGAFAGILEQPGLATPAGTVKVAVHETRRPAVLALVSARPVRWDLKLTPEARVARILLVGDPDQQLKGAPAGLPVERRGLDQACGTAQVWEGKRADFRRMMAALRCSTGLREASFQGCTSGLLFEVPHYRQDAPGLYVAHAPRQECPGQSGASTRRMIAAKAPPFPATPPPPPAREPAPPNRPGPDSGLASPLSGKPESLPPGGPGREDAAVRAQAAPAEAPARTGASSGVAAPLGNAEKLPSPAGVPQHEAEIERARALFMGSHKGPITFDAVPDLIAALRWGDLRLRCRAADELGRMRPPADAAVEPLMDALRERSPRLRASAALALGNIGPAAEPARKLLEKALKDKSPDVRLSAREALERLDKASGR